MPDWLTLHVVSLVLVAAAFGGMIFFMAVFAPSVFRFLPREDAAVFMRSLFPTYFLALAFVSLIPALVLLTIASYRPEALAMLAVSLLFFAQRGILLPVLNRSREAGREKRASALHRASVLIHLVQWLVVTGTLVRLAA
ncbi:MAG: DUF4149 domain-containing protein [Alphaproteobacteria bacterium]|nr:DUF4149 domain-containing protein [Alphaproteobacteria bacterium]